MLEFWDNLVQLSINMLCGIVAWFWYIKSRRQPYFMLACFYSGLALGLIYWTLYLHFCSTSPRIFYVSDLSWTSAYIFLGLLAYSLTEPTTHHRKAAWLAPAISGGFFLLYVLAGASVVSGIDCIVLTVPLWFSIRGLSTKQRTRQKHMADLAVVAFVFAEYLLWTSSSFLNGENFSGLYFTFDVLLSVTMLALLPAIRKAVEI